MNAITLSEIHIYPVKSFAGIQVDAWKVDAKGLELDRKWMVVDREHQFLSQRRLPEMVKVETRILADSLQLSAPGMGSISFPLTQEPGPVITTSIWKDDCPATLVSAEIDQWLSDFLHTPCHLVYQADETVRQVDQRYAAPEDKTSFTDGFPFLIISENSLAVLNRKLPAPLPMSRFRPNLVVTGCDGFAEDTWRRIRIADIGFRLPKPSGRCPVTTIDAETARYGKEPLKTLSRFRKLQNKVYFGQNAIHDNPGTLRIGDEILVHETGAPQPDLP